MISRIIFFLSFTTNISTCDVCLICRASERAGDDDDFVDSAKKYIWLEIYVWKMYTIVKNWITRTLFNCIYFYPVSLHSLHSLLSLLPPLKIQRGEGGKNKFRIKSKGNITLLSYQVSQRDNNKKKKHNRHTIITYNFFRWKCRVSDIDMCVHNSSFTRKSWESKMDSRDSLWIHEKIAKIITLISSTYLRCDSQRFHI